MYMHVGAVETQTITNVSIGEHEEEKGSGYTIRHRARPLRGITKYHSHKFIASTWDNCVVRRVRNGCTMEDSTPFCTLCRISLPLSSKQRTMSTSDEAPSLFYKHALFLTRELRVIITLTVLLLVISHARQLLRHWVERDVVTRPLFLRVRGGVWA